MSYISSLRRSYKRYRLYNRYSNPVNVFLVDVLWYAGPVVLALLVLAFGHSMYLGLVQNQQQAQLQPASLNTSGNAVSAANSVASGTVERLATNSGLADGSTANQSADTTESGPATLESTLQAARQTALDGAARGVTQTTQSVEQTPEQPEPEQDDNPTSPTPRLAVQPNVLVEVASDTVSNGSAAADSDAVAGVDDAPGSQAALNDPVASNSGAVVNEQLNQPVAQVDADLGVANLEAAGARPQPTILKDSWIFEQDESKYTVQFGSSASRELLREFASEFPEGTELVIYQSRRASVNSEFGMVHGVFDSIRDATEALEALPQQVLRYGPWIRRFSDLKTKVRVTE